MRLSSAQGDRSQRIVDFVGHAGGQKAHAGQLLAAHHLLGAFLHLAVEVLAHCLEPGGHVVHGVGQLGHFVVRVERNAVAKFAGRHAPRSLHQHAQRVEYPGIEQANQQRQQQRSQYGHDPAQKNQGSILRTHLVAHAAQTLKQELGQLPREIAQLVQLQLQRFQPRRVAGPGGLAGGGHDAVEQAVDLAHGHALASAVVDARFFFVVAGQLPTVLGERFAHVVQAAADGLSRLLALGVAGRIAGRLGAAQLGDDHAHVVDLLGQLGRQRQLSGPTAQAAHQVAIGIHPVNAADRQRGHDDDQQTDADQQLIANGPFREQRATSLSRFNKCRRGS